MKNFISTLLFLAFTICVTATTFTQLKSVNSYWQTQADANTIANLNNNSITLSQQDWIALHLQLVSNILLEKNCTHLSKNQLTNRKQLLHRLQNYADAKTFPINNYSATKTPVFIDVIGTHCAVGYLMQQSNAEHLAQTINATQQFAYIKDITTNGVQQWANTNGFSLDELAWIQPTYAASTPFYSVDSGVNGTVNCLLKIDDNTVLLGGSFTTNNKNTTCNNIAMATNTGGAWAISNIGTGANAPVKCMYKQGNIVYIGGDFTSINGVPANRIAKYDLLSSAQPFSAIGSGIANGSVHTIAGFNNTIYVGGSFTNMLSKWTGSAWQSMNTGTFVGNSVNALYNYNNDLYFGGDFEFLSGSLRKNSGLLTAADDMHFVGYYTVNPVNDYVFWNNNLYAACSINSASTDSNVLYKYNDTIMDWVGVLTYPKYSNTNINKFLHNGIDLFVVGNFYASTFMSYGQHCAEVKQFANTLSLNPLLSLDAPANCGLVLNNKLMIGGSFKESYGGLFQQTYTANKIGYINYTPSAVQHMVKQSTALTVYPNPTTGSVFLPNQAWQSIAIYNTNGECVDAKSIIINNEINVQHLPVGNYFLIAKDKNQHGFSAKFTKQ
jgi:hypothetical protein